MPAAKLEEEFPPSCSPELPPHAPTPLSTRSFAASTPEDKCFAVVPIVPGSPSYGKRSPSEAASSPQALVDQAAKETSPIAVSPGAANLVAPLVAASPVSTPAGSGPDAVTEVSDDPVRADVSPVQRARASPRAATRAARSPASTSPLAVAAARAAVRAAARAKQSLSALLISPDSDSDSVTKAASTGGTHATPESAPAIAPVLCVEAPEAGTVRRTGPPAAVTDVLSFRNDAVDDTAQLSPKASPPPAAEAEEDVPFIVQFRSTPLRPIPEDQSVAHGINSSDYASTEGVSEGIVNALQGVYDSNSPPEPLDLIGDHPDSSDEEWMVSTSAEASEEGAVVAGTDEGGVTPPVLPPTTSAPPPQPTVSQAEATARATLGASAESMSQRVSGWWSYNSSETAVDTDESPMGGSAPLPAGTRLLFSPAGSAGGVDVSSWMRGVDMAEVESAASAPTPAEVDVSVSASLPPSVGVSAGISASPTGPPSTEDLDDYSGLTSSQRAGQSPGGVSDAASASGMYGRRLEGVGLSVADLEESAGLREALLSVGSIVSAVPTRPGSMPLTAPSPMSVPHAGLGAEVSDPELLAGSPLSVRGSPVAWGVRGEVSEPVSARLQSPAEVDGRKREELATEGDELSAEGTADGGVVADMPSPPLMPQRSAVEGAVPSPQPAPEAPLDPTADLPHMQRSPGPAPVAIAVAMTRRQPQAPLVSHDGPVLDGVPRSFVDAAAAPPSPLPQTGSYCTAYRETWDIAMSSYSEALQDRAERLQRKLELAAAREAAGGGDSAMRATPVSIVTPASGASASAAATAHLLSSTGWGVSTGSTRSSTGPRSALYSSASPAGHPALPMPASARGAGEICWAPHGAGVGDIPAGRTPNFVQPVAPLPATAGSSGSRHVWSAEKSVRGSLDLPEISAIPVAAPSATLDAAGPVARLPESAAGRPGKIARMKAKVKSGLKGLFRKKSKA